MKEFIANYGTLCVSILTIIVAIAIPWYLANRQNKIDLFEKRFEVYLALISFTSYCNNLLLKTFKEEIPSEYNSEPDTIENYINRRNEKQCALDFSTFLSTQDMGKDVSDVIKTKKDTKEEPVEFEMAMHQLHTQCLLKLHDIILTLHSLEFIFRLPIGTNENIEIFIKKYKLYQEGIFDIRLTAISTIEQQTLINNTIVKRMDVIKAFTELDIQALMDNLQSQIRLTKPYHKCITCIKSVFCEKD